MFDCTPQIIRQYRIILSADTASEARQLPKRCLSRKTGIVRCCLKIKLASLEGDRRDRALFVCSGAAGEG